MTQNKQFKLEVRRYAEQHGLTYADARRRILEARNEQQDSITVKLAAGTYVMPGMDVRELGQLRPVLDAMNEPSE